MNNDRKLLILYIYDKEAKLIDDLSSWTFKLLEEKLFRKLKYLAMIKVEKKIVHKVQYFRYISAKFYTLKEFQDFINLIEIGAIHLTIKIGVYKSEDRYEQIYNHGISFDIEERALEKLLKKIQEIP